MSNIEQYENSWCFACGKDNPIGLKLEMNIADNKSTAYFTPRKEHESYGDRMHGGLVSTMLDEVMGNFVFRTEGRPAYTASIEIRFRNAVRIGETIKIEGWVTKHRGRLFLTEGRITKEDGTLAAEATAKMMLMDENK
jgi:acyl-coenzyme A thioesterase PaaI-like protein